MPLKYGEVHMKKNLLATSCIVSLAFCAAPAFAQTATPQAAAEEDNVGLGEIIVTARKIFKKRRSLFLRYPLTNWFGVA
jgi:hypothetical protein